MAVNFYPHFCVNSSSTIFVRNCGKPGLPTYPYRTLPLLFTGLLTRSRPGLFTYIFLFLFLLSLFLTLTLLLTLTLYLLLFSSVFNCYQMVSSVCTCLHIFPGNAKKGPSCRQPLIGLLIRLRLQRLPAPPAYGREA